MAGSPDSQTSLTLLEKLKRSPRDEQAWTRFVAKYQPRILGWCRDRGLQPADAEDVSQNVLLILAEKLPGFVYDSRGSFRAWLRTVTENACNRWAARRPRDAGAGDLQHPGPLEGVAAPLGLAQRLEEAFDQELLEAAMARVQARLLPRTWAAFQLTALEGLSGAEAGRRLGMPTLHVFVAKSRVQKMLREELGQGSA